MPHLADGTFKPQDASVSKQLSTILSTDSPLLTKARTSAAQVANRRGLLNSSMAVQAGEAAAFDVALPIASQQAGQLHQANLQRAQIGSTEALAERELKSRSTLQAAELGSRSQLQAAELGSRTSLQASELESRESLLQQTIVAEEARLGRQLTSAELIQTRELASREAQTREALQSQERTTAAEISGRQAISNAALAVQERIAASNISSFDREKVTAALAQFDRNYEDAFRTISANENIPVATRETYLTHLLAIRDTNFNLVEQLYGIDLVWA